MSVRIAGKSVDSFSTIYRTLTNCPPTNKAQSQRPTCLSKNTSSLNSRAKYKEGHKNHKSVSKKTSEKNILSHLQFPSKVTAGSGYLLTDSPSCITTTLKKATSQIIRSDDLSSERTKKKKPHPCTTYHQQKTKKKDYNREHTTKNQGHSKRTTSSYNKQAWKRPDSLASQKSEKYSQRHKKVIRCLNTPMQSVHSHFQGVQWENDTEQVSKALSQSDLQLILQGVLQRADRTFQNYCDKIKCMHKKNQKYVQENQQLRDRLKKVTLLLSRR